MPRGRRTTRGEGGAPRTRCPAFLCAQGMARQSMLRTTTSPTLLVRRALCACALLLGTLFFAGCPTPVSDAGPRDDAGQEQRDAGDGVADDAGAVLRDAGPTDAGRADAGQPAPDAGADDDAGTPILDAGAGDDAGQTRVDAGGAVGDPGPVQCREDTDCGGTLTCNRSAPGGICLGCGECPGDLECGFGACIRSCSVDADCNAGFNCLGSGRCGLRSCSTNADCGSGYGCSGSGTCERTPCDTADDCPAGWTCGQGRCLEPASP